MTKQYRPYMGEPFEYVGRRLAEKLNEMSMDKFDDLAAHRRADYELWKRILPDEPFPISAARSCACSLWRHNCVQADVAKALSEKTVVAKFKKGKLVSERVISPRR